MTSELVAADPGASMWLPTPKMQAREQPWDMAVEAFGAPAKLLVYENKSLEEGPAVTVCVDQLLAFLDLWRNHRYFFYALPALSKAEIEKASAAGPSWRARLRLEPTSFGDWLRVLTPLEVLWVLSLSARSRLLRRMDDAIRMGSRAIGATRRIPTDHLAAFPSLNDHLHGAVNCAHGRLIEPGENGAVVGHLLAPHQRVQTVGAVAAAMLAEQLTEPPSHVTFLERLEQFDLTTRDVSVDLVPAPRADVVRHLLTTTWVTLRVP